MKRKTKKRTAADVINVTLSVPGRQVTTYGVLRGSTVADVFNMAGAGMNGEIRLNGREAKGEAKIERDSTIRAIPRVNGA